MSLSYGKTFAAALVLSTLCVTTTANASDAFNKFPQQQAAMSEKQAPQVSTRLMSVSTKSQDFAKKRRFNRVVEPVTTGSAVVAQDNGADMARRFNKMVSVNQTSSRAMPVLKKHAVIVR